LLLVGAFPLSAPAFAGQATPAEPSGGTAEPRSWTSQHVGTFHGTEVRYTATAGETFFRDEDGVPEAALFSVAYVADGVADPSSRPVTFLWNGGPGSASVWLHMGVFGPMRVDVPSDARDDGGPPYRMLDNPGAFLDVSDVVFIDPVGTGFSRTLGEGEKSDHYGVTQDARSVARFIRQWISENNRWNSPKFIGGESYGTTRSAAVVRELESRWDDVSLNGIILISAILDFSIENHAPGNELPNLMHLPTMAATAHYHGMAGSGTSVADWAQEARTFALNDYAHALLQGDGLSDEERVRVRKGLARLTGLSEAYLDRAGLRLTPGRFQKELLRERGLTVGRLDSRYTGVDADEAGERTDSDPSFYGIDGAYTATLNTWLRDGLGVDMGAQQYSIIGGLGGRWDWDLPGMSHYTNVAPWIGRAMRENSGLHVFVAAGYYDFATPFFSAEYSLDRVGADHDRVTWAYYEAGHMMYVHHPSLAKLQRDVRSFLIDSLDN
jgi:carboxypeptidase C (cathepsin A)